jgi:hypothetical protein
LPPRFDKHGRPIENGHGGRRRLGHGGLEEELAYKVGKVMEKVFGAI